MLITGLNNQGLKSIPDIKHNQMSWTNCQNSFIIRTIAFGYLPIFNYPHTHISSLLKIAHASLLTRCRLGGVGKLQHDSPTAFYFIIHAFCPA